MLRDKFAQKSTHGAIVIEEKALPHRKASAVSAVKNNHFDTPIKDNQSSVANLNEEEDPLNLSAIEEDLRLNLKSDKPLSKTIQMKPQPRVAQNGSRLSTFKPPIPP